MSRRRIGIMLDFKSRLRPCLPGLYYLKTLAEVGLVEVVEIIYNIHNNQPSLIRNLLKLQREVDVLIVGGGPGYHLAALVDVFLRKCIRNYRIAVIGVAFPDQRNSARAQTAIPTIAELGTRTVFKSKGNKYYAGLAGFRDACERAALRDLPQIKRLRSQPLKKIGTVAEAIMCAQKLTEKKP